ncbi:dolichyl-di-phosphooligosaccharide-protein glycotransferase subunit [Schizosaccharomyces japonicus yFS275]|uniref:Dolichyl-diphosphooligosaccharide--protein glycosyltransferase subunit WBP1 n=1 Tax=Schizosaccharomyces japonicus (strain yFS275 / FY16936) TaxID=402676 RepID=B6JXE1_SCHJY|nr:dolichyl-di-phosphooligosaccharide-protein glycotransferase subunit [Schizosaccharomyces japonicus yFS275]EEB06042.1 dolichyl-di-phosphooligosaccharide-protein glycotransferase subunit [Schizosaccharomyces japonicus yFS275]
MRSSLLNFLFFTFIAAVAAVNERVLAIFDHEHADYESLLDSLRERDFDVTVKDVKAPDSSLFEFGERKYDDLLLFSARNKGLGASFSPKALIEFVEDGGNILLAAGTNVPEGLREFGRQLGIFVAERGNALVDHFASVGSEDHQLVALDEFSSSKYIVSDETRNAGAVLYKGSGHALGENPLVEPVLRAKTTSYLYNQKSESESSAHPWAAGSQLFVVSSLQTLNGSRVAFSSSLDIFKNEYLSPSSESYNAANALFARDLTNWVFQRSGRLVLENMTYGLISESVEERNGPVYRIKDEMEFTADMSVYENGVRKPYIASDVQMELVMLDPYYRLNFEPVESDLKDAQRYSVKLVAPDHYGVFSYKVRYSRPGLTNIDEKQTFTLRQFHHNEYPRFLPHAYPYYTSAFIVFVGFVMFAGAWLFFKPAAPSVKKQQ